MTEEEVVATMQKVAKAASYKFQFGYYKPDDIEQEAYILCIEALEKYDGVRPLENFLRVHVKRRLCNLKRDKYERRKPCFSCPLKAYIKDKDLCTAYESKDDCKLYVNWLARNSSKKNLMNPVSWDNTDDVDESEMHYDTDILDDLAVQELLQLLDTNIPSEVRKDWIKIKNGIKIPKHRRAKVKEEIALILKENNISVSEAW
jgi:DNA-directed RNA polymerase specialized sigma24 family protein